MMKHTKKKISINNLVYGRGYDSEENYLKFILNSIFTLHNPKKILNFDAAFKFKFFIFEIIKFSFKKSKESSKFKKTNRT